MNRKNSALRVAFLTGSSFDEQDAKMQGELKKRAIRRIQREVRYPVVENSTNPDIIFRVIRREGGGWMMRKHERR
jgi:predicted PP-loop superfamily ATPase